MGEWMPAGRSFKNKYIFGISLILLYDYYTDNSSRCSSIFCYREDSFRHCRVVCLDIAHGTGHPHP